VELTKEISRDKASYFIDKIKLGEIFKIDDVECLLTSVELNDDKTIIRYVPMSDVGMRKMIMPKDIIRDDLIDAISLGLKSYANQPISAVQGIPMTYDWSCCDGEKFLDEFELLPEAIRNKILILMRLGKQ